jgi:hypothetical protein
MKMGKKETWYTEDYKKQLAQFMQENNPKLTGEEWENVFNKIRSRRNDPPENVKHEVLGEMDFNQVQQEPGWKYFKMPEPEKVIDAE